MRDINLILDEFKEKSKIDPNLARNELEKIINLDIENNNVLLKKYTVIAYHYWTSGDKIAGRKYINKALSIVDFSTENSLISFCYTTAGNVELLSENLSVSLSWYLKALDICEDNTIEKAILYNNIGSTFLDNKDFKRAEKFLNQSLNLCDKLVDKLGDKYLKQILYINFIELYIQIKNTDRAEMFLEKLEKSVKEYYSVRTSSVYYQDKFLIETQKGNYDKAMKYYNKGKEKCKYLDSKYESIVFYIETFDFLVKLEKDKEAIENLTIAKKYCISERNFVSLRKILSKFIEYYKKNDDHKKCISFLSEFYELEKEQKNILEYENKNTIESIYEEYMSKLNYNKMSNKYNELTIEKDILLAINNNLHIINEIAIQITATFEFDRILEIIYQKVNELFDIQDFLIGIIDGNEIEFDTASSKGIISNYARISLDDTKNLSVQAILKKKEIITNDVENDYPENYMEGISKGIIIKSLIFLPLIVRNKVIGVISAQNKDKNAFSNINIEFFRLLSSFVAVSLCNSLQKKELSDEIYKRSLVQKQLEDNNIKLLSLAQKDELTDIFNRRTFENIFINEFNRALRSHSPLSLLIIDIDYFKQYNDTYGHIEGDNCIKSVVKCIKAVFKRRTDLIARYGGDEFIILLPDTNKEGAENISKKSLNAVRKLNIDHIGSPIGNKVTISIGSVTRIVTKEDTYDSMLRIADEALYYAKRELGKDAYFLK